MDNYHKFMNFYIFFQDWFFTRRVLLEKNNHTEKIITDLSDAYIETLQKQLEEQFKHQYSI